MNVNNILVNSYKNVVQSLSDFKEGIFRQSYKDFSGWLHQTLKSYPITSDINNLFFGLIYNGETLNMYIAGSSQPHSKKTGKVFEETYKRSYCADLNIFRILCAYEPDKRKLIQAALKTISAYVKAYIKSYPSCGLKRAARRVDGKKTPALKIAAGFEERCVVKVK